MRPLSGDMSTCHSVTRMDVSETHLAGHNMDLGHGGPRAPNIVQSHVSF